MLWVNQDVNHVYGHLMSPMLVYCLNCSISIVQAGISNPEHEKCFGFNNPVMHLYHHARDIPENRVGVNFAISLSLWDYIFRTNYIPEDSGNAILGFKGDENFPKKFISQNIYGFFKFKK